MVQGTASSVGKSLIAAALCRVFAREGLRVLPFKAQNMSNNAAALPGGGEIGRAQALQAMAARVEPRAEMNPVLIKPEGDARSQVVVLGKPWKTLSARDYYADRDELWRAATGALDSLRACADLVVIEGAGSPVEMNLKERDIVNMAIARYANSPVLLVGDIDQGGIFAQLVGTLELLEPEERDLVQGLVINKFRGDISLLEPAIAQLAALSGKQVLGAVPWLSGIELAEEDGAVLEARSRPRHAGADGAGTTSATSTDVAVIRFPRLANFDDLDALSLEEGVSLRFVAAAGELGSPDAIILPGTKATLADLDWLRATGLDLGILWHVRLGGAVLGICGGFQMLGEEIRDDDGIEGPARRARGLGLLSVDTAFKPSKRALPRRGRVAPGLPGSLGAAVLSPVEGYEIHAGASIVRGSALFELEGANGAPESEGCWVAGGRVMGSYLHGLFDLPYFRRAWLGSIGWAGASCQAIGSGRPLAAEREAALDRLADAVASALDMHEIGRIAGIAL
jgi:adenosylcobyric acid synthase